MDRGLRFSAGSAQLCWRVKNSATSVPFRTLRTLPDGSELSYFDLKKSWS